MSDAVQSYGFKSTTKIVIPINQHSSEQEHTNSIIWIYVMLELALCLPDTLQLPRTIDTFLRQALQNNTQTCRQNRHRYGLVSACSQSENMLAYQVLFFCIECW